MRKLIIFVAVFMLLSVPALAVEDTAEVQVNIPEIQNLVMGGGPVVFNLTDTNLNDGSATIAHALLAGGHCNDVWDLMVKRDAWDIATTPWGVLVSKEGAATLVDLVVVGTDYTILDEQTAGGFSNWLSVAIDGLTWASCGPDDDTACTLTFSLLVD